MLTRGPNFEAHPLNIVGSSVFGRYPKISVERTVNLFISDGWLVPYAGYKIAIPSSALQDGKQGRGSHTSTKLNCLIIVIDNNVFKINISFNQQKRAVESYESTRIGQLQTISGPIYISENNKPQIAISDNKVIYIYDPAASPQFQAISTQFVPGYIDFHDTYFLCAASYDAVTGTTNSWRISASNDGISWPDDAAHIGSLQTKPDNTQAVLRFPSRGNMIFVMGRTVTEPWFDVGYQLFPYQRNTSSNVDYGCLNPTTIASIDELVVWLAINEKGGPVIMYSDGGMPKPITTDGIDYLMSNMKNPADSQAFIYRQDGHIFYHINFYTDNLSLFYDFNTQKFFHASDENGNYFIASSVAFFNNQYYFVSKNNGNLYAFDTIFTTYDGAEIPRIRTCKNIRNIQQETFVANDCGFTIESGETPYIYEDRGPQYLITEDGRFIITESGTVFWISQDNKFMLAQNGDGLLFEFGIRFWVTEIGAFMLTQDGINLIFSDDEPDDFDFLISEQNDIVPVTPRVDLAISIDGGQQFSSFESQQLPYLGYRINKLAWWQLGWCNDLVCEFRFYGIERFVCTDGVVNTRR